MELVVMTYNIKSAYGAQKQYQEQPHYGLPYIAEVIRRYDPDIVALQEVNRFHGRTNYIDQSGWLAEALGMHVAFVPASIEAETPYGRTQYGNALLSRYPIVEQYHHHLFHRAWVLPGEPSWVAEARVMLEAKLDVNGRRITAYSLHLSTSADQQAVQLDEIDNILKQIKSPQVVMGDFNTNLKSRMMAKLCAERVHALSAAEVPLEEQNSFPWGRAARQAIDHIITSPDIEVMQASVVIEEEGVSDHNPVIAKIKLKKGE